MSARTRLGKATFVQRGYGQVEPNHLSGPRSGRVYAQLPADKDIELLENGQFVKYDYANGVCNFTGVGEWMLVLNEIKIYRDFETDADFAMKKDNYTARVYSPAGQGASKVAIDFNGEVTYYGTRESAQIKTEGSAEQTLMPEGTTMVPRVIGTELGDIFTTNTIMATSLEQGNLLIIGDDGYLKVAMDGPVATVMANHGGPADPIFQVVKVYTMPDNQPGVKLQRVA